MPLDLAMITLISSNYPCLEHIFMAPKVFELLKFSCIFIAGATRVEPGKCNEYLTNLLQNHMTNLEHATDIAVPYDSTTLCYYAEQRTSNYTRAFLKSHALSPCYLLSLEDSSHLFKNYLLCSV